MLFFAPAVLSPVVIAFLWKYMFNPAPDAGLNAMLGFLGLGFLQQNWLGDPSVALWAVGLTVVWQFAGFSMVIFLAALQGIPRELEEAAAIDGAGRFQRFHRIVLPLIAPAMTINLTLSTIGGLKLFDQVFAITNGGPGYSTETLSTLIYKQAFVFGTYGYSTAVALVLTLLVAAAGAAAGPLPAKPRGDVLMLTRYRPRTFALELVDDRGRAALRLSGLRARQPEREGPARDRRGAASVCRRTSRRRTTRTRGAARTWAPRC